jgi:hypothetical protein
MFLSAFSGDILIDIQMANSLNSTVPLPATNRTSHVSPGETRSGHPKPPTVQVDFLHERGKLFFGRIEAQALDHVAKLVERDLCVAIAVVHGKGFPIGFDLFLGYVVGRLLFLQQTNRWMRCAALAMSPQPTSAGVRVLLVLLFFFGLLISFVSGAQCRMQCLKTHSFQMSAKSNEKTRSSRANVDCLSLSLSLLLL